MFCEQQKDNIYFFYTYFFPEWLIYITNSVVF